MKQDTKLTIAIVLLLGALVLAFLGQSQTVAPTASASPTTSDVASESPTGSAAPTPTKTSQAKPVVLNYWPDGVVAEDVSNTLANDKTCTFDMCVFVQLTAKRSCSSITLDGDIYDINDELFDSFSSDYKGLKKGQSRIVELGDDIIDDNEDYVELADATCYK